MQILCTFLWKVYIILLYSWPCSLRTGLPVSALGLVKSSWQNWDKEERYVLKSCLEKSPEALNKLWDLFHFGKAITIGVSTLIKYSKKKKNMAKLFTIWIKWVSAWTFLNEFPALLEIQKCNFLSVSEHTLSSNAHQMCFKLCLSSGNLNTQWTDFVQWLSKFLNFSYRCLIKSLDVESWAE